MQPLANVPIAHSVHIVHTGFNGTTNADSGASSLRQAVADASAGDTITFDANLGIITLTTGQIDITKTPTIIGPVAGQTIDSNQNGRIFGVTQEDLEKSHAQYFRW